MLKRLKRLFRKRNNSGFTLVEVIVACALLAVLMLGIMGFMTPVLNSVADKEQNARAVMLSEAIDSYIAGSIKYAYYVQTFTGVTPNDVTPVATSGNKTPLQDMKYSGTDYPKHTDDSLQLMLDCLNNTLSGTVYEIRCIGVRWVDDAKSGGKKCVVTNEIVDQTNCALDELNYKPVFEDCFYEGLYPIISFENYLNQYQMPDSSGNMVDKVDPANVDLAAALRIKADIYLDPECYNIKAANRQSVTPSHSGIYYIDFQNIGNSLINSEGKHKMQPNIDAHTYDEARALVPTAVYLDGGEKYYYPNTFIYYICRKTNSTPATPAPGP